MSATVEVSIWLALKSRIETLPFSPPYPIAWPKAHYDPPEGAIYLEVLHLINQNQRLFMSPSDPTFRRGILQISVMSPLVGQVHEVDLELAGEIAAHFAADTIMRHGDVAVKIEQAPDIARSIRDEDRWRTPVSVRWYCFA